MNGSVGYPMHGSLERTINGGVRYALYECSQRDGMSRDSS